jgi:hypothetical protein
MESYLEQTVSFWNPNRERCWARIARRSELPSGRHAVSIGWEGARGLSPRPFGEPPLGIPGLDHLLVWPRGGASRISDLPATLGGARAARIHQAELYTFAWGGDPDPSARASLLEGVAVAQSRGCGLLVQPHYQEHRFFLGPVPIPVWEESAS